MEFKHTKVASRISPKDHPQRAFNPLFKQLSSMPCTTQHVFKVLRAPAHTQRPNFTPGWRVFLTFSQLTWNSSRAPAERKYGIMACLPKHHYNSALHISWLISKPVTSPHCWAPLCREKSVILFTKASASPRSPTRLSLDAKVLNPPS